MLLGLIVKSQKELYYVKCENDIYLCKARGVFREKNIKPLVGDKVVIQVLEDYKGYIEEVLERKNSLIRPPIANIDQIIMVYSLKEPQINYAIFDKYLVMLEHFNIPVIIVINKIELADENDKMKFEEIYSKTDYNFIYTSVIENKGINNLHEVLKGKISSFAGPSGVGKSSLINLLHQDINMETGDISKKTSRGKHTTRHVEIFEISKNTFIFDTPGFSSLSLDFIKDFRDVKNYFTEFHKLNSNCKFNNCEHINEPKCAVKSGLKNNTISISRYENYKYIREEIKNRKEY